MRQHRAKRFLTRKTNHIIKLVSLIRYVYKAVSFEKIIPQQYPEIVHLGDHPPKALKELWHGEKWRHTPQLNRPMERIYIDDSIRMPG
jgi:hypothetical protein